MNIGMLIKHKITITPTQNMGFIVKVGCGTFCATTVVDLIGNLNEYLACPDKWEREYSKIDGPVSEVATPGPLTAVERNEDTCEDAERPSERG